VNHRLLTLQIWWIYLLHFQRYRIFPGVTFLARLYSLNSST